jgi:hypothetical protein
MMINFRNVKAVPVAAASQPTTGSSLAAKATRAGDLVSINPQPLPPKEVSASVRALAASQDLFLAPVRTDRTGSAAVFKSIRGADSFAPQKATLDYQGPVSAALKKIKTMDQLEKAERLMEQAYLIFRDPNSNDVDRIRAKGLRNQAVVIQMSVEGLSDAQTEGLAATFVRQWNAMLAAADAAQKNKSGDPTGLEDLIEADQAFELGVQDYLSLIDWIQSE